RRRRSTRTCLAVAPAPSGARWTRRGNLAPGDAAHPTGGGRGDRLPSASLLQHLDQRPAQRTASAAGVALGAGVLLARPRIGKRPASTRSAAEPNPGRRSALGVVASFPATRL